MSTTAQRRAITRTIADLLCDRTNHPARRADRVVGAEGRAARRHRGRGRAAISMLATTTTTTTTTADARTGA